LRQQQNTYQGKQLLSGLQQAVSNTIAAAAAAAVAAAPFCVDVQPRQQQQQQLHLLH
jgi:hypothetical protein